MEPRDADFALITFDDIVFGEASVQSDLMMNLQSVLIIEINGLSQIDTLGHPAPAFDAIRLSEQFKRIP